MNDAIQIPPATDRDNARFAERFLPLVYDELRRLAVQRLTREKPGQTLQATALVHDVYLRLLDSEKIQRWENREHFFAAAAETMRRILVEAARRKNRFKHGGGWVRSRDVGDAAFPERPEELIALDEALDRLAATNAQAAELVKLRYFAGFTNAEAAACLDVSPRKANQIWAYARAWLREEIECDDGR